MPVGFFTIFVGDLLFCNTEGLAPVLEAEDFYFYTPIFVGEEEPVEVEEIPGLLASSPFYFFYL
jgi:hypothetical protein